MANTTNFGWETPDDTDLVKDGAAAMRTLGNAIDASLVDLKGGTTGQVLSKNTNTDMDFTWVTTDDANAIQNAIVDAKGDLIAASAADTPARLAVGANGETLVADSSATTGLRWQSAANANAVINGGMDIWQRGTSFAGASSGFCADRWRAFRTVAGSTFSRQSSSLTGIQYALRMQRDSGNTSTNAISTWYTAESADAYRFAGQTVTLSFYARVGANFSATSNAINVILQTGTGTDQAYGSFTGASSIVSTTQAITTSWVRYSFTASVASTATQFAIEIYYVPTGTAGANDWLEITGVQLEVGSVATTFKRAGATLAGELAACRRYLPAFSGSNFLEYIGYSYATNNSVFVIPFDVPARVAPTGVTASGTFTAIALNTGTNVGISFNTAGVFSGSIIAAHTITAGQGSRLQIASGALLLFTGCEL